MYKILTVDRNAVGAKVGGTNCEKGRKGNDGVNRRTAIIVKIVSSAWRAREWLRSWR